MLYTNPPWYDSIHDTFTEDIPFWITCCEQHAPTREVWELGCGSGRVAVPLAQAGFSVLGIDSEPAMVRAATHRAAAARCTARFTCGDMRTPGEAVTSDSPMPSGNPGAVLIPLHSLSHLLTTREVLQCLTEIRAVLHPQGVLALAVHMPDLAVLSRDPDALYPLEWPPVLEQTRYDAVSQVLHCRWWDAGDGEDDPMDFSLRMFFPREMELLLLQGGFILEEQWGWYDRSPLEQDSGTHIVVARRSP